MTRAFLARRLGSWAVVVSFTWAAGGCVAGGPREPAAPEAGSPQKGLATYYADSLAGNKTASGERYDPGALTAAHRTLPFGTVVEVTRSDGRSVRVRINDRGPFASKKRIIDLSRRAAEELGMIRDGVVSVTVTIAH
jgi:rare lipoprotein A